MKTRSLLLRLAAALAVVASAPPASAALLDHGPGDPVLLFPTWYRDLDGTCWLNVTGNPIIGTAPVDTTGKFQVVPLVGPTPTNPASVTCQTSNGGKASAGVVFN